MGRRVLRTLLIFMLSVMTGCASGPFHRKPAPAPAAQPAPPELSQTPLYSPEMSEGDPHLPSLPSPTGLTVVPAPEPVAQKSRRIRKIKPTAPATPKNSAGAGKPGSSSGGDTPPVTTPASTGASASSASDSSSAGTVEKKQASTQVASSGTAAASPIGELTTGSSADAAQTSHQTEDLIRTTREGLENVKRALSDGEKKTAAEIRTFLTRAQQALKNGDVDGAFGLATKAKLLLDELTGS